MPVKKKSKSVMDELYEFEDDNGKVMFSFIKKKGKHKRAKRNTKNN